MKVLLDQKKIKLIAAAIIAGMTYEYSATIAGIDRRTFYVWRRKGRLAKTGIYRELHTALEKADALFVQKAVALINAHGRTQWQACAWLLERRHPEIFGRYDRLQAKLMQDLSDELKALRAELASKLIAS